MKKVILFILLSNVLIAGNYVGIEYGSAKNITTQNYTTTGYGIDIQNDYSDLKFKYGTGTDGGIKLQTALSFITLDKYLFDTKNNKLLEIGFDLVKEFKVTPNIYPFIKGGVAVGSLKVDGYIQNHIINFSYNFGMGITYKVTQRLDLIGGIDHVGRKWQDVEYYDGSYSIENLKTTDSMVKSYFGINYKL